MSSEYFFEEAKKRVKKKKDFYGHLAAFCAVGIFFFGLALLTGEADAFKGFSIPMLGWSIGLIIHYLNVFGFPGKSKVLSQEWEQKEIDKEMRQMGAPPYKADEIEELELKEIVKRRDGYIDDDLV